MIPAPATGPLFAGLAEKRPPWKEFGVSMIAQCVALALLAWLAVFHHDAVIPEAHTDRFISLVSTPPPVNHEPAPVRQFKTPPVVAKVETPALKIPAEVRVPKPRPEDPPVPPKIEIARNQPAPLPAAVPVIPRQLVKTNVFSQGSSATPTMAAAPSKVQTGGFGDPNGVPAHDTNGKPINIAAQGSYDLPTGPGYGNGTGGAKGARGVVASAGFGNGVATGDGSGRTNGSRGTVRQGGFGDTETATAQTRAKPADSATPKIQPAEIISKPTPVYTAEARQLRIEGEVLLEVVFESTGKLRVVRVVRGLGHGLDEAAIRAAEQIRFKPALQDGKPADSNATLHIVFQTT